MYLHERNILESKMKVKMKQNMYYFGKNNEISLLMNLFKFFLAK